MLFFLIDDDPDDQEFFSTAIRSIDRNFKCITCDDAIKAIEKLRSDPLPRPDLIFIDMHLPRLSGKEAIPEIKRIEAVRDVPIVLYSTSSGSFLAEEALKAGAAGFFTKPLTIPKWAASVEEVIQRFTGVQRS